jgi:hypothetical protein
MREASGRGFYQGPDQQHRSNKTDYGNAVWHLCTASHRRKKWTAKRTTAKQAKAKSSRSGRHVPGVDGKLLTELLGTGRNTRGTKADEAIEMEVASAMVVVSDSAGKANMIIA